MTTAIEAVAEAERCRFVQASEEAMWIARDEARFTAGSHRLLLERAR